MDSKKTTLTPELKEIYDRVMNTTGASQPQKPAPADPTPPSSSPPPITLNQLDPAKTPPPVLTPPPRIDPMPQALQNPTIPPPPAPASPQMPSLSPADQALTNTPLKPVTDGNTFAFNGATTDPKQQQAPQAPQANAPAPEKKKSKISLPILIAVGAVFLIVWGVFWAVFLGIINF